MARGLGKGAREQKAECYMSGASTGSGTKSKVKSQNEKGCPTYAKALVDERIDMQGKNK